MRSVPVAVLASGRGSNFEAIQRTIESGELRAKVVAVISDVKDAPVLEKAKNQGIPAFFVPVDPSLESPRPSGPSETSKLVGSVQLREEHEKRIFQCLQGLKEAQVPRFLILAGYRRIIGPFLLECFRSSQGYSRIVNIHPSLLPAFPGLGSYAQAFRYGVKVTGATVHLVEEGVDSGPICAQEAFSIADCANEEEVERRGLEVEHRLFPQTLGWVLEEKFEIIFREIQRKTGQSLTERRLCVCPN